MPPAFDEDLECLTLGLADTEMISRVARALSVQKRVEILALLGKNNIMSVNEIAQALDLPISSASMHISILQEAKLLACERMSGIHGSMKMCTRKKGSVFFQFKPPHVASTKQQLQTLPIGAYSCAGDIEMICGLASQIGPIGPYNTPSSFYLPERFDAQILWLQSGYLDYDFSPLILPGVEIESLELSFEACTQALYDHPAWQSELRVLINDRLIGCGICSCDTQGRRGIFNPSWWPDVATQHGELLKWRVTTEGSYLRDERISDVTVKDLNLTNQPMIKTRILVPKDSAHHAGLNLFGNGFGDYNQAVNLVISYRQKTT